MNFLYKAEFSNFLSYFFAFCLLKLDEPFRHQEIFKISFFNSSRFFMQFLDDNLPLGSGFLDLNILVDPDPGRKNLADPTKTDPDPKHCLEDMTEFLKIAL